jgi:hypothetical protein
MFNFAVSFDVGNVSHILNVIWLYVIIRLEETNKKWNYCKIQTVQCPPSVSMSQYTSIPFELVGYIV